MKNQYIREDCLKMVDWTAWRFKSEIGGKEGGCPMDLSKLCTHLSCITQFLSPAIFITDFSKFLPRS